MAPSRWNDDLPDDYDQLDDEETSDDESALLLPCPECQALIHEESERCPACGNYITFGASNWSGRHWLWLALGLLGIAAVVLASLLGT